MLSRVSRTSCVVSSLCRFSLSANLKRLVLSAPKCTVCSLQFRTYSTENKDGKLTNRIFTLPNIMSGIRLALAPCISVLTIKGLFLPSLCTFAFASVLDFADGYVARHFNQRSRLGTFLDPVADKTLMVCLAIAMGYSGLIHIPVAGIIIGKDILMGLGFFGIAWKHGYRKPTEMMTMIKSLEVKPSLLGKTNTALQMILFISGLCRPLWAVPSIQLFLPLEAIVSCTTVATLFSYAFTVNKSLKWSSTEKKPSNTDETM